MAQMQQKFDIVAIPTNANEANQISIDVTQRHGAKGWELVSALLIQNGGALLLILQKPM